MNKIKIIEKLKENYSLFSAYIHSLSSDEYMFSYMDKWTGGQQLDHIYRSTKPLARILLLPKFILMWLFGVANRPSKSYEDLVKKYHSKLAEGGRASGPFVPNTKTTIENLKLQNKIQFVLDQLIKSIQKYSEQELDQTILPHPLLGKITLREMLYFTIYHVEHHHHLTKNNLSFHN